MFKGRIFLIILLTSVFITILNISTLSADTIIVDTTGAGDYITIQDGINAATEGDTILVHPATYEENIDFLGKNIIVASLFLISEDTDYILQTIIDGNQNGSVARFANGEDSTTILTGFTIINGNNTVGGGVFCNGSSPRLEYLLIVENTANAGGGIICVQSNASMNNLTIYGNSGGGVACNSSNISLDNCILWNDTPDEIVHYSGSISVNYSDIQGGWQGIGNIDEDPQFVNTAVGNFNLTENSPCINSGNPYFPPDPDGTRPDMGAFYYYNDASEIVADFCADSTVGFSQLTVQFTDLSAAFNCEITSWNWDFGDGDTSIDQNPIHDYESGGFYTVSLTVEDDNGNSETETKEDYIIVYTVIEDGESVSGTWHAENSPYLILGDAIVYSGDTLVIEPGSLIQFQTGTSPSFDYGCMWINGTLIAQGSLNDSIIFTYYESEGLWGGLMIGSADSTSIIEYSKIEFCAGVDIYNSAITIARSKFNQNYGFAIRCRTNSNSIISDNYFVYNNECALFIDYSNPMISNNIIKDNGLFTDYSGIICFDSNPIIENNIINNNGGNGIYLTEYSSPLIKNNTIEDNGYPGIYCGNNSNPTIENNTIIGNQWGGVYCEFENNPYIINNIIKENEWGIYCLYQSSPNIINNLITDSPKDGICCANSSPLITNNTIVYNGLTFANCAGIFCADDSDPIIKNTILWENSADFDYSGTGSNPVISYSLIQDTSLPYWIQDAGNNIFAENPLFVNEVSSDFNLQINSPCIDTGTPDTTGLHLPICDILGNPRIYNDTIDIGAYEWQGYGVDEPDEFNNDLYLLQNKPNPFSSSTAILFMPLDNERIKDYSLSIYNIKGQLIKKYNNESDNFSEKIDIVWDGTDEKGKKVPSGVYFYKLSCDGYYVAKKMLLIR